MFHLIICFIMLFTCSGNVDGSKLVHELTVHKTLATWREASLQCRREGGMLASPVNGTVLNLMRSMMSPNITYYIGIRAGDSFSRYLSIEGVPLKNMTEAVNNMVHELDAEAGDCMAIDRQSIRIVPCWTRLQYFCYKVVNNPSASLDNYVIENWCSDELDYKYHPISEKCYKVHRQVTSWDVGYATCLVEGGRLAVVENENDKQSILNIYDFKSYSWIFVGLRDYTGNGDWKSVKGQTVANIYNIWTSGSKPVNNSAKPCGALHQSGKLENLACSNTRNFICELDPNCWLTAVIL